MIMTDALGTPQAPKGPLDRPPVSGPGSGTDKWAAYAAQQTGEPVETFEKMSRDDIMLLLDHKTPAPDVREAPEGVEVIEPSEDKRGREIAPEFTDGQGRPVWAIPVEGGYVSEDELRTAERDREAERQRERHQQAVEQLRQRG